MMFRAETNETFAECALRRVREHADDIGEVTLAPKDAAELVTLLEHTVEEQALERTADARAILVALGDQAKLDVRHLADDELVRTSYRNGYHYAYRVAVQAARGPDAGFPDHLGRGLLQLHTRAVKLHAELQDDETADPEVTRIIADFARKLAELVAFEAAQADDVDEVDDDLQQRIDGHLEQAAEFAGRATTLLSNELELAAEGNEAAGGMRIVGVAVDRIVDAAVAEATARRLADRDPHRRIPVLEALRDAAAYRVRAALTVVRRARQLPQGLTDGATLDAEEVADLVALLQGALQALGGSASTPEAS